MECCGICQIAHRVSVECELRVWFASQGVSEEGAARAVQLLDRSTLLAQPRPRRWNRRGDFGLQERCRYLWYRHAARILGWCDRRRFPDVVTAILRQHAFPSPASRDEATREDEEGSVAVGHAAQPIATAARRRTAGQSSCMYASVLFPNCGGHWGFRDQGTCVDWAHRASHFWFSCSANMEVFGHVLCATTPLLN